MVRLRKDKWYSSEGQRGLHKRVRREGLPLRRLVGLIGLLIMVLILMQYAADPEIYRHAFEKLGVPFDAQAASQPELAVEEILNSTNTLAPTDRDPVIEERDFWSAVLADLPKTIQTAILRGRVAERSLIEIRPAINEALNDHLEQWRRTAALSSVAIESPQEADNSSTSNLDRLAKSARRVVDLICSNIDEADDSAAADLRSKDLLGFDLAVDTMARSLVRDASPWRKEDRLPLALSLSNVSAIDSASIEKNAIPVEPIVLSQQPALYRGRLVKLRAKVARTATVESSSIAGSRFTYQVVWVRPVSGVARPVCVCIPISIEQRKANQEGQDADDSVTNKNETAIAEAAANESLLKKTDDDEAIDFVGVFYKRLAYQAQKDIQVAPVLVAMPIRDGKLQQYDLTRNENARPNRPNRNLQNNGVWRLLLAHAKTLWQPPTDRMKYSRLLSKTLQPAMDGISNDVESLTRFYETTKSGSPDEPPLAPKFALQALFQLRRGGRNILKAIDEQQALTSSGAKSGEIAMPTNDSQASEPMVQFGRWPGVAVRVDKIPLIEEDQQWFEKSHVFAVEVKSDQQWFVVCESIPSDWQKLMVGGRAELNTPVDVEGMRPFPNDSNILFSTGVNWRIDSVTQLNEILDGQPAIDQHLAALATSGWNFSWRDLIRRNDRRSINSEESQAFYELLRYASRKDNAVEGERRSVDADPSKIPFMDMFKQPTESQLKNCHVSMLAIRIARVDVGDPLEQRWLGAKAYFVIDGIAQLESNQQIVLKDDPNSDDSVKFSGQFPVTIATTQIPDWLSNTGDTEDGSDGNVWFPQRYIKVDGIYFRLWSFDSDLKTDGGKSVRQTNPLIVATKIESSTLIENNVDPWFFDVWKKTGSTIFMLGLLPIAWIVLRYWSKSRARKIRLGKLKKD